MIGSHDDDLDFWTPSSHLGFHHAFLHHLPRLALKTQHRGWWREGQVTPGPRKSSGQTTIRHAESARQFICRNKTSPRTIGLAQILADKHKDDA